MFNLPKSFFRSLLLALSTVATPALATTVVEFYNTNLDNYFITADANEAAQIDSGSAGPGWIRTGDTFESGGSTPVCRFYGSQSPGPNSHFYTVDANECEGLKQQQAATPATDKRWNFESLDFISTPPTDGTCSAGTVPVYRAYNNGSSLGIDSNHRITTNLTAIQQVMAFGWSSEGVVMCAPDNSSPVVTATVTVPEVTNTNVVASINARVKFISELQAQTLSVTSEEQIMISDAPVYALGDILVFPDRLLMVTALPAIQTTPGYMVYFVRRASISEAFDQLQISGSLPADSTVQPLSARTVKSLAARSGVITVTQSLGNWSSGFDSSSGLFVAAQGCNVATRTGSDSFDGVSFDGGLLDLDCTFEDKDDSSGKDKDGSSGSININGKVGVYGDFSKVQIDLLAGEVDVDFQGLITRESGLKINQQGKFSVDKEFKLGEIKAPVVVPEFFSNSILRAGNVNYVIPLKVVFGAHGEASIALDVRETRGDYFRASAVRKNGRWSNTFVTKKHEPSPTINLTGNANFSTKTQLQLGLLIREEAPLIKSGEVGFYVAVGPELTLGGSFNAGTSNLGADFTCSASLRVLAELTGVAIYGNWVANADLYNYATPPQSLPEITKLCAVYPPTARAGVSLSQIGNAQAVSFQNVTNSLEQELTVPRTKTVAVKFDASSSSSGGQTTLRYDWSSTNPKAINFDDPGAAKATASIRCSAAAPCAGNERIILTITTAQTPAQTAQIGIPINFDEAPIAKGSVKLDSNQKAVFDATASTDEGKADGTTKVEWKLPGGQVVNSSFLSTGLDNGVSSLAAGQILTLSVTDKFGQVGTSAVTVTAISSAGTVSLSSLACTNAVVSQAMSCRATGLNLPTGLVLKLSGGADCTGSIEVSGGTATQRNYTCTPSAAGLQTASLWSTSASATLIASQVTVASVPAFTCINGQVLQGTQCVTPTTVCTAPKTLVNGQCVTPTTTILPAPTLSSPNGVTGVSTTPTFSWSPVTGADRYWLMVATSPSAFPTALNAQSCSLCISTGNTDLTSYTLPNAFPMSGRTGTLSTDTTYYWKVQAWNSTNGNQGQYSSTGSFTTALPVAGTITASDFVAAQSAAGQPITGSFSVAATNSTVSVVRVHAGSVSGGSTCYKNIASGTGAKSFSFNGDGDWTNQTGQSCASLLPAAGATSTVWFKVEASNSVNGSAPTAKATVTPISANYAALSAAANQPPTVSSASAVLNADRSLTVTIVASDPEGSTIGVESYISNAGSTTSFNASSKKTLSAGASGSTRTITWTAAEAASFMTAGQNYVVRVDAFDSARALGQRVSNTITFTAAAAVAINVSGISPTSAPVNTPTTFTISGANFTAQTAYQIQGAYCSNKQFISASTLRMTCEHNQAMTLSFDVKDVSGGTVYGQGQVNFTAVVQPMTVTSINVSPSGGFVRNVTSTLTVTGTNITASAILAIQDAVCTAPYGHTSTVFYQKCTPQLSGSKTLTVKMQSGGTTVGTTVVTVKP